MRQEDIDKMMQEGSASIQQKQTLGVANSLGPADKEPTEAALTVKAFLDDIWSVYKKYRLALDRVGGGAPLLVRALEEHDESRLREALDTTAIK